MIKFENRIHIISFDVPYPPDYGGAIDVYYKIRTLNRLGVEVILHCYEYGRGEAYRLNEICKTVYYYRRPKTLKHFLSGDPFIIATRKNQAIVNNIEAMPAPVLFEGLHTCALLNDPVLSELPKIVRTHNIEHHYYEELALIEKNPLKRYYFKSEARKLKRYESILKKADSLLCISKSDLRYFSQINPESSLVTAFHPNDAVSSKAGKGSYALFHGNLSVGENENAVFYLLEKVVAASGIEFIVAGKNPSEKLTGRIHSSKNVKLIANPSDEQMLKLIRNAHICVLPTFQNTGLKLKLLHSLYSGRFVITNLDMVKGTGLEQLVSIADSPESMLATI